VIYALLLAIQKETSIMAQKAVTMRKIQELLRLQSLGLGQRLIARSLKLSLGAVNKYLHLCQQTGLTREELQTMEAAELRKRLRALDKEKAPRHVMPVWETVHQELQRKGVTLKLLHEEYVKQYPHTHYRYTQFCHYYKAWKSKQNVTQRQTHKAGDELFIDYAGPKVPITDPESGKIEEASLFIAVLGASTYTYAELTQDQTLASWIGSHVRAFAYLGGVPRLLVPDNLKAGVSKACRYDPDINPAYAEMAAYYNTAVLPARPYRPQDKSAAENGVQLAERWILARLRGRTFYSLSEANQAIRTLLEQLNHTPFQKKEGTRYSQFKEIDEPALHPLPDRPYAHATFKRLKVGRNYHLTIDSHDYSVPYAYVQETVDVRLTAQTVEIFLHGQRIASHIRQEGPGMTTNPLHQTDAHYEHQSWTLEKSLEWAKTCGPSTQALFSSLVQQKAHPRQAYRLFLGFRKLARRFNAERLEAACERALLVGIDSYARLCALLEKGLDQAPLAVRSPETPPIAHPNIRGAGYYH
jgi:transposase